MRWDLVPVARRQRYWCAFEVGVRDVSFAREVDVLPGEGIGEVDGGMGFWVG